MKTLAIARRDSSGFTLIELVISAALTAMILVSAYLCLNAGFASQKLIEPRAEVLQNARVAMTIMTADLRAACPLSKDYPFLGMHRMLGEAQADNLDFGTHNYRPTRPREGDFCQESLFIEKDPETGQLSLWRRRNPMIGLNPVSGGKREEIARGLLGLRFEYYDGLEWYDTWGDVEMRGKPKSSVRIQPNLEGMPEAVRITLLLDSEPKSRPRVQSGATLEKATNGPPLVFQTVARLNLAGVSQSSGSTSTGTQDGTDQSGQPGQAPGNGGPN